MLSSLSIGRNVQVISRYISSSNNNMKNNIGNIIVIINMNRISGWKAEESHLGKFIWKRNESESEDDVHSSSRLQRTIFAATPAALIVVARPSTAPASTVAAPNAVAGGDTSLYSQPQPFVSRSHFIQSAPVWPTLLISSSTYGYHWKQETPPPVPKPSVLTAPFCPRRQPPVNQPVC